MIPLGGRKQLSVLGESRAVLYLEPLEWFLTTHGSRSIMRLCMNRLSTAVVTMGLQMVKFQFTSIQSASMSDEY